MLRCLWVLVQLPYWYDVAFLSGQDADAYEILIQNPVNCTLVAIKAFVIFKPMLLPPHQEKKEESKSFGGKTKVLDGFGLFVAEPDNYPQMVGILMIWMTICLIASIYTAVMRQELRASFFLAQGLLLSFRLHSLVAPETMVGSYDMYIMVALCHCGIHPLALVIPLLYSTFLLVEHMQVIGFDTWIEFAMSGVGGAIDLTLFAAFTWDFTQRVRAVSSGILLGDVPSDDDPALASPAAGRSARRLCWPLVFESYLAAGIFASFFPFFSRKTCGRAFPRSRVSI